MAPLGIVTDGSYTTTFYLVIYFVSSRNEREREVLTSSVVSCASWHVLWWRISY